MTVGDLQAQLATLDKKLDAMILLDGSLAPVIGLTPVAGAEFLLIRGKGKTQLSKRFTLIEKGLIGHLVRLDRSNDEIGEVLGRSTKSVAQCRKALGI